MEAAEQWQSFVGFSEGQDTEDDAGEHRECLGRLKAGMKGALKSALGPRGAAGDAARALELIERILHGQTCSFGNHMFGVRQTCIVLIHLLKLLPEPAFEASAPSLVRVVVRLAEQLGRQDFPLLRSFVSDCAGALAAARERPVKLHAFPKFIQRCRVDMAAGAGISSTFRGGPATPQTAQPGLPLELDSAARLSCFCVRLSGVAAQATEALSPFIPPSILDGLMGETLALAAEAAGWAESASFDTAEAARIVAAGLASLRQLPPPAGGAERGSLRALPLHLQAQAVEALPRVAGFALRGCGALAHAALAELSLRVVVDCDEVVLFPRLGELLVPLWLGGGLAAEAAPAFLRVLLAAAARFGAGAATACEPWRTAAGGAGGAPGDQRASQLATLLADPTSRQLLASMAGCLGAQEHACRLALSLCSAAGANPALPVLALSMAVQAMPPSEAEAAVASRGSGGPCAVACSRFAEVAVRLLGEPPGEDEANAQALQAVLEALLERPALVPGLRLDGAEVVKRLLRPAFRHRRGSAWWPVFNLSLEVFVVESPAPLPEKLQLLQGVVARPAAGAATLPHIEAAAWVAIGRVLASDLDGHIGRLPSEAASAWEPLDDPSGHRKVAHARLLQLVLRVLQDGGVTHSSVLAAIAYVVPLIVTLSYLLPGFHEQGARGCMPALRQAFGARSPCSSPTALSTLGSPTLSVANPLRAALAFAPPPAAAAPAAERQRELVPLPAPCPFCNGSAPAESPPRPAAGAPGAGPLGCSLLGPPCGGCASRTLQLDWRPLGAGLAGGRLRLPEAWCGLRRRGAGGACWLQGAGELLDACARLRRALPPGAAPPHARAGARADARGAGALRLLEPGDTQLDDPAPAADAAAVAPPPVGVGAPASRLDRLVDLGLLGACASASARQLRELAPVVVEQLRLRLPQHARGSSWECTGPPCPLLALVQCSSFVEALAGDWQPGQQRQEQHHRWRLAALGGAELAFGGDPAARPRGALWPPLSLWAVLSAAPPGVASAALASLVAACVAIRAPPASRKPATWSLQQLWTLSMTAPFCIEELLHALQGGVHVRLFEKYARGNFRVDGICQLILRGPLKLQVRALLPKVLPAMVLTKNVQTIEEICALLEESAQSLFTPQLPYILSAMARQPVESMAGAFKFISERVYSRQMSITSICDASLGQVLVLILWNSVSPEGHEESRRLCRYAVENIVGALKASAANAGAAVGAAASTRPPLGAVPWQPQGQRRTIDSVSGGAAAGTPDGPPRKRRTAGGGTVGGGAAVAAAGDAAALSEVVQTPMQTLEDSFLHVLDILEIVLSGNRQSPKWEEYSPLLCDSHGDERRLDHGRLLAAIALLFELVPQSLHRFSPKVLEFLHSASELSGFHPEAARCWQLFVEHVGVAKLRLLLPAVVAELLRLAARLRPRAPGGSGQICLRALLDSVVCQTCRVYPELVASLPRLPPWPELSAARAALGGRQPEGRGETPEGFSRQLEAGLEQLESAAQQAVRRAALEHITSLMESQRPMPARITQLSPTLLSRLMRALLKFLWESSAWPEDQLMCGRLLGSCGAIDPARLSQLDLSRERLSRTPADLGSADQLAKRVLADFLVPNLTGKNSYAFAAQEILKYLQGCGRAPEVLAGLSQDVRETLRPYMHSSYQLVDGAQAFEDTSTFDGVVALAVGLTNGEQRALFLACLPAAHGNHALSLFLMHHVLHSLLESRIPTEQLEGLAASLGGLLDSPNDATAQAVFSLVDDLIERREKLCLSAGHSRAQPADAAARERMKQRIGALQSPITHRRIVSASVRCGAHARALQFLEQAIIDEHEGDGNVFDDARIESEEDCLLLQSIYRDLDEPDGALGALRAGPATAKTRALRFEQESRWQDVQSFYEVQLASTPQEGEVRRELLCRLAHCPHNLRRFESSLRLIEGMDGEDLQVRLRPLAVEAAWQLSSWGRLERALEKPAAQEADDFQVSLGQALLKFHQRDSAGLESALRRTTLQVTQTVASAARESYTRAYQHLLKLHVLSDLSWLAGRRPDAGAVPPAPGELAKCLLDRAEVVVPTFSAKQLVLSPLRTALQDMGLADDCKRVELAVVQLCRKHGAPAAMEHPEVSFAGAGVSAETLAQAQLEWGRLLYARGSRHDALRHMRQLAPRSPKARLLGARWATEPAAELLIPRVAEAEFKIAKDSLPADEAACFYHAAYLDRLLKEHLARRGPASAAGPPQAERSPFDVKNLITFTLRGYLQALRRGTKRLHFILNRVLQLAWDCCELEMHKAAALEEISAADRSLEPWMWYPVLPQLISRLQNPDMRELFKQLIAKVLMAHPHQAGWQIMQLSKSSCKEMVALLSNLLTTLGRKDNNFHRVMCRYSRLFDQLIRLAQFQPEDPRQQHISLDRHDFAKLVGGFSHRTPTQGGSEGWRVIVPLQSQMTAAIPRMRLHGEPGATIDPFPEAIFAEKCHNVAEVLRSKEKPKKITFLGDDGRSYPFLCKSEKRGDLRKDSRMMEFGLMVNQLLQKNPDARRRNLGIRTFNVVILMESCGLIEWVPNTKGLRPIIEDLWNSLNPGVMLTVRQIKDMYSTTRSQYETFTKEVLRRNPPIMHRWFSLNADPSVWLSKRLLFSRTQALWCMLGYLVGLGDRHGENILVEQDTGQIVHVDFDCLFGKGMHLECPETVPFRLTQNCVAAMGVTGVEGVFQSCCELVMGVLRDSANRQTILSVLHVFIADPLIEWARRPQVPLRPQDEKQNRIRDARITIGDVEKKLDGMLNVGAAVDVRAAHQGESVLTPEERGRTSSGLLGRDRGVGLSVAGQVDELLKAAMCKRNLSEMYVGWQSWQ